MELAIRGELRKQGYNPGRKIVDFKLVAIERPGWVCIYEFTVATRASSDQASTLFGVAHDDGRSGTIVRFYEDSTPRDEQRATWSEGMILAPHLR